MAGRIHGGNLTEAAARHGGAVVDWLDLSTGINPVSYPVGDVSADAWRRLPEQAAMDSLLSAARTAYGVHQDNGVAAAAGGQTLIQMLPRLAPGGSVRVMVPTYNEHAGCFRDAGFEVAEIETIDALAGAGTAILVNPNNPDGQSHDPAALLALAAGTSMLVVDEAFGDVTPEQSLCSFPLPGNVIVLRSFGKFFGLGGVRLGFAIAAPELCRRIEAACGLWPVSGPALEIGARALSDASWIAATRQRLREDMTRLRSILTSAGFGIVGGTDLFVTVAAMDAQARADRLASARIWVRRFDYRLDWLRFGLPGNEDGWRRLEQRLVS